MPLKTVVPRVLQGGGIERFDFVAYQKELDRKAFRKAVITYAFLIISGTSFAGYSGMRETELHKQITSSCKGVLLSDGTCVRRKDIIPIDIKTEMAILKPGDR